MENKEVEPVEIEEVVSESTVETCPICGSDSLVINGRCRTCYSCGYSLCSM